MNKVKHKVTQTGFSLLEIMVALAISATLLTGVMQVHLSSKRTYNLTENLSRMQENARFAIDLLARDIRMAGFMPCRRPNSVANTINNAQTDPALDFFGSAIVGYDGNTGVFPAGFPATGGAAGERVAGADALILMSGGSQALDVVSHNASAAVIGVAQLNNVLQPGDIAMICDSRTASIFQVTNANSSNSTIVHNQGSTTPGNCTQSLGGASADCANPAGFQPYSYSDGNGQIVKFESTAYYIGVSSADPSTSSLYRNRLGANGVFNAEELLEGIESMQLLYGVDNSGDAIADQYVAANVVVNWNTVVSVRMGLLMHTPDEVDTQPDNKVYNVAGELIGPATAVAHKADRRSRFVFSSTVKLRNRGI